MGGKAEGEVRVRKTTNKNPSRKSVDAMKEVRGIGTRTRTSTSKSDKSLKVKFGKNGEV